eukprot:12523135-Alexandrium_andersonii.AAC.1
MRTIPRAPSRTAMWGYSEVPDGLAEAVFRSVIPKTSYCRGVVQVLLLRASCQGRERMYNCAASGCTQFRAVSS